MARFYKRDSKGRFAKISSRRAAKKSAKRKYRGAKAQSKAQLRRDLGKISTMSESEYNRYLRKGTYAGSKIFGQDLSSAAYDSHSARKKGARAAYKSTVQGSRIGS